LQPAVAVEPSPAEGAVLADHRRPASGDRNPKA
jgi:hypothetical protein